MKYVKENLTLVICAGVAVLFLVFAFAPIPFAVPSLKADLAKQMQDRYNHINTIKGYEKEPLVLPGVAPAKGIPTAAWVDARNRLMKHINQQQKDVEEAARTMNALGRVKGKTPLLPVLNGTDPGQMTGDPMDGYLPKVKSDPMTFKTKYGDQFRRWTGLLATGSTVWAEDDAAVPPTADALRVAYTAKQTADQAALPGGAGVTPGVGLATNTRDQADWARKQLMNRAAGLRMYVEMNAFQKRGWYGLDAPPDDLEVFEAFVDSWIQSDVVKAILAANKQALDGATEKNVGKSGIKRLTRIVIGNNARTRFLGGTTAAAATPGQATDPGALFYTSANAAVTVISGQPVIGTSVAASDAGAVTTRSATAKLPDTANKIDYTLGVTGRSAGATYDVVYLSVVMDLDPAYLFKFIDQLYKQNMCYTVVNMQARAVDPLDRASNGYLYGDSQVIEVELLVECILFRSWTEPLMPDQEKLALGGTPGG